jgi:hypothetical protein
VVGLAFFYSEAGESAAGSGDYLIRRCYALARYYRQHPRAFLTLPFSEVEMHLYWTEQLIPEDESDA